MNLQFETWQLWTFGVAAGLILIGIFLYLWRRRPHDPEETERARRAYLNQIGRIAEGQVVEIIEQPAPAAKSGGLFGKRAPASGPANGVRTLVSFTYSISGVTYQAAQDVTGFENRINLSRVMNGQHASVKYDQANPTNSILLADDWSGFQ